MTPKGRQLFSTLLDHGKRHRARHLRGRFNKRVTLANRETPTAGERLQVACVSEKRRGQRQLTLFWTLLVGQPRRRVW